MVSEIAFFSSHQNLFTKSFPGAALQIASMKIITIIFQNKAYDFIIIKKKNLFPRGQCSLHIFLEKLVRFEN